MADDLEQIIKDLNIAVGNAKPAQQPRQMTIPSSHQNEGAVYAAIGKAGFYTFLGLGTVLGITDHVFGADLPDGNLVGEMGLTSFGASALSLVFGLASMRGARTSSQKSAYLAATPQVPYRR